MALRVVKVADPCYSLFARENAVTEQGVILSVVEIIVFRHSFYQFSEPVQKGWDFLKMFCNYI